eukprot:Protomagalhaensia_wolfi_Nauph_80__1400@NODE_183_length_3259_cov_1110_229503_g138_i0_p4_GENE_NODE_183_length_3259_cov_1110_229503_g138_i0NODE_183_length_3259_cov_1110_229503_g138_i0_p4_ORF_typecomplete_len161_score20_01DUF998/PF06197_13/0_0057_NODE_183_length_3259_cov_1110_229503_g138_i015652047
MSTAQSDPNTTTNEAGSASGDRLRKPQTQDRDVTTTQAPADDNTVVVPADADEDPEIIKDRKNQQYAHLVLYFWFSFLLPPLGWVGFVRHRDAPRDTPRGRWAFRACCLGSFLAFAYTFAAACVVGHFGQFQDTDATDWGCGFGGKCPLFSVSDIVREAP